jgi:non-canonical purine NTP pyrophosphatase (RdgB/HAM1 family)
MHRIPVESSDIISVGYDPKGQRLEIEFHGGRIYQYRGVSAELHEQFMRADSHGSFFNTFVNNKFRFDRIDEGTKHDFPKELAFVTGAARKVRTLQAILEPYGIVVEQLELPIDEIQSEDAADIATKKAKHAYHLAQRPVVVTDTCWNILALRGFPGAYMHDVANWLRAEDFLKLMQDKPDRTIIRTDTLVYYDGKRTKLFAHDYTARLAEQPAGQGLSIDQLVIMEGQTKTIAQQHETEDIASTGLENSIWQDFAKWLNMQRRLGKA